MRSGLFVCRRKWVGLPMYMVFVLRWCGYANVGRRLHLKLVHCLAGFGDVDVVAVTVRHVTVLLLSIVENHLVISSVVV